MRKRLSVIGSVILATMLLAGSATAAEDTDQATDKRGVTVGAHQIKAKGTGTVMLDAAGKTRINLRGNLQIVDHAGDAVIYVRPRTPADEPKAERQQLRREATYTFESFNGIVWVRGSDFTVKLRGKVRKLTAKGTGTLELDGRGLWWTRHRHGRWNGTITFGVRPHPA